MSEILLLSEYISRYGSSINYKGKEIRTNCLFIFKQKPNQNELYDSRNKEQLNGAFKPRCADSKGECRAGKSMRVNRGQCTLFPSVKVKFLLKITFQRNNLRTQGCPWHYARIFVQIWTCLSVFLWLLDKLCYRKRKPQFLMDIKMRYFNFRMCLHLRVHYTLFFETKNIFLKWFKSM